MTSCGVADTPLQDCAVGQPAWRAFESRQATPGHPNDDGLGKHPVWWGAPGLYLYLDSPQRPAYRSRVSHNNMPPQQRRAAYRPGVYPGNNKVAHAVPLSHRIWPESNIPPTCGSPPGKVLPRSILIGCALFSGAAPKRALGRAHGPHTRAAVPAGRRAHLLHARPDQARGI